MNTDRDNSKNMTETPLAPTEISDRELIVFTAPGEPWSDGDIQVGAMEPSTSGSEKTGRREISLVVISTPSNSL